MLRICHAPMQQKVLLVSSVHLHFNSTLKVSRFCCRHSKHRILVSNYLHHQSYHKSSFIFSKEHSKIEETVKVLKESKKKEQLKKTHDQTVSLPVLTSASGSEKRTLLKRVWDELVHYYHGFRLLFIDLKVSTRLVRKILHGDDLTRREHKQLVRTVSDLFRMLPFSIFIAVPFMELLLPVALKLFPEMLPSTFQTSSEKETKLKKQLKVKIEMAKFLHVTLDEMAVQCKGEAHSDTAKEFVQFFDKIRSSGEQASNEDILKFSKLFEDEITLDSLSRPQLNALCRLLELQTLGTNSFLRFQLRMKLRNLNADDKMIIKEGIEALTVSELQAACRARGMRALGIPEERLQSQLKQWLELSLNENIPPSLLLLSSALYLPETLPAADKLKATISTLPPTAATEAKYKIGEMEGKIDNKTKLELIKKEEEEILKEAEELKQENEEVSSKDEGLKELELQNHTTSDSSVQDIEKEKDVREIGKLSKEDIDDLEDALENISNEKKNLLIEKEELEDLKEDMAEYTQDIKEFKDTIIATGTKELKESKAALRLSKKVNSMIGKLDHLLEELSVERKSLQHQINTRMKEGITPEKERDDIISINELVLAIRRLQKISDDTKLQRIEDVLEKMDVDQDGSVEVDHVLKVIELLGKENVKVTGKQMNEIIDLLVKEDSLEQNEKQHFIPEKNKFENSSIVKKEC